MTTHYKSDFISSRDLITDYHLLPNFEVSIEHLRRPLHADSGHLHLVPSHFGLAYGLLVDTNHFPELIVIFPDYSLRTSLGTFSILLVRASFSFQRLREANLTAKSSKCFVAFNLLEYISNSIGEGILTPNERKLQAIHDAPRPDTEKQVC